MNRIRVRPRPVVTRKKQPAIKLSANRQSVKANNNKNISVVRTNQQLETINKLGVKLSIKQPKNIQQRTIKSYPIKKVTQPKRAVHEILAPKKPVKPIQRTPIVKKRQAVRQRRKPLGNRSKYKKPEFGRYIEKIKGLRNIGVGRVLVMIACGPSVKEAPLELLKGHVKIDFMVINKPYGADSSTPQEHKFIWPPRYWVFCDNSQYNRNQQVWNNYGGLIINSSAVRSRKQNQILVKHRGGRGFSKDLVSGFHIGRSTTFANMQTALWMNYDKIYIFGLDMCAVSGQVHHYGQNPDVTNERRVPRFKDEAAHYAFAAQTLSPKEREKFVICSSYNKFNFVDSFDKLDQKVAPKIILERLSSQT